MRPFFVLLISSFISLITFGQDHSKSILKFLDQHQSRFDSMAYTIWKWAEPGYLEEKTTSLMQDELKKEGFSIQTQIANIPTAFIASYGTGKPIIGILAEMDALPGLSQEPSAERKAIVEGGYGHACGHNLFGAGSIAAVIALKKWMEENHINGTIRLYGTPAEEGAGGGKTYLVRAGVFKDVDAVLHWHPGDHNSASPSSTLAYKVAMFRFKGLAAHAAAAPDKGRSALDGVEAMNYMMNMMREHVPQETRIHYVIKNTP
jgi:aminobenzoyl-glutamate utilization protein B